MGTTTSSTSSDAHHEDLQFLADRFPFGDAELHRLYNAYLQIIASSERSTFLQDWAVQSTLQKHLRGWKKRQQTAAAVADDDEGQEERQAQAEERRVLLQVVEEQILIKGTGNALYQAACMVPGDAPLYPTSPEEEQVDGTAMTTTGAPVDEYTRKARLEQMFTGFTSMGRKGAKEATKVMFQVAETQYPWPRQQPDEPVRIHALSLAQWAYALALATSFLEAAAVDDEQAMADFTARDPKSEQALQAMAMSMVAKGKTRLERDSIFLQTKTNDTNAVDKERVKQALAEGYIDWDDLWEWTEDVGPLMASVLPSLMQTLLFPDQPAPPSRTAYKFPRLSHPSVFFTSPTSSSLFKLGCLTASLSGTYHRLYTSASDGLSFNRLIHALVCASMKSQVERCVT